MAPKGSSGKGKSSRHRSHKHRKEEEEQLQQSDSSDVEAAVRSKKSSKSNSSKHRDSEKDESRRSHKRRHNGDSSRTSKKSKAEAVVAGPEPPTPLLVDYAGGDDEGGHSKNRKSKGYSESAKLKPAEPTDTDYKTSHNKTTIQHATLESKENVKTEKLKDSVDYKKEKKVKKEKEKERNQQSAKGSNEWKDEETRKSEGEELENDKRRARDEGDRRKDHKSSDRKERQKELKHKEEDRIGRNHHGDRAELLDYKANRSPSTSMKATEKNRYDSEGEHKYSYEREGRNRKDNSDYRKRSKDQRYEEEVRRGDDRHYRDDDDYYYSDDARRHRRRTEKSHRDEDPQRSYKEDECRYRERSHRDSDSHRREEKESEHRHRDVHEPKQKESKDERRESSTRSRRASSSKPADSRSRDGDYRFPHDERKDYTHGRSFLDSDYRERSRSFDDDEYRHRHKSYKDERYYKDEDERSLYRGLKDQGDEKERHGAPDDVRSERSRKGPSSSRSSVRPEDASGRLDRTPVHRRSGEFAKGPDDPWSWNRGQFPQFVPHYAGPFPGGRHFSTSMYGRAMELAYPPNRFMGPGGFAAEDGYPHSGWYGVPSPAVMDDATASWDRSRDSWSREDYYSHISVESLHMSRPEDPWPSGFEEKEQDACNLDKPPPDRPSAKKTRISVQMRQLLSRLSVSEDLAGPDAYGRYINFMEKEHIDVPNLEKSAATDVSEPDEDLIFEADPEAEALLPKPDVIDAILPPLPTHIYEGALKAYRKPQEENRLRKSLVGSYILPAGCHSQTVIHPDNSTETAKAPIKGCTTDSELRVEVTEKCCLRLGDSSPEVAVDLQSELQGLEQTRSDSNGTDTIDRIIDSKTNSNRTDTIESNQLPDSNGSAADFEEESMRQFHEAAVTLQDEQLAEGMSRLPQDEHKHHGKSS